MNRYANKRHRGPTHRGFEPWRHEMEGNIPVIAARKLIQHQEGGRDLHIRAFYRHPTKGWRSTGPEGSDDHPTSCTTRSLRPN